MPGCMKSKARCVDLQGRGHGRTDARHLGRRLAPAQRADDPFGRDQPVGVGRASQIAQQHLIQPMPQPVGVDVVGRVVERDLLRVEPLQRRQQMRLDRLVVGDDLRVHAQLFGRDGVEAAHDGDALARAAEQQRALPGQAVRAVDQRQHRVAPGRGLAHEGQPGVDAQLVEDGDSLSDFFLD